MAADEPVLEPGLEREFEAMRLLARDDLERRLVDVQRDIARLRRDNAVLDERLRGQQTAQADIYEYLHAKLEDNYRVIDRLETQASAHRAERARKTADASRRMEQARVEHEARVATLLDTQRKLELDVAALDDFWKNRADLQADKSALEQLLENERAQNLKAAHALIDRNSALREELQADMRRQIQETRTHMVAQTESLLEDKTKRKIMQNEVIKNELKFQSRESDKLQERFEVVDRENKELRRQINEAKHKEQDAAASMHATRRGVDTLQARLKSLRRARKQRASTSMTLAHRAGAADTAGTAGGRLPFDSPASPLPATMHPPSSTAKDNLDVALERLVGRLKTEDHRHRQRKADVAAAETQVRKMVALQDQLVSVLLEAVQDCSSPDHDLWSQSHLDDAASMASTIFSSRTGTGHAASLASGSVTTAPTVRLELMGPLQRTQALGLVLAQLHNFQLETRAALGPAGQGKSPAGADTDDGLPSLPRVIGPR